MNGVLSDVITSCSSTLGKIFSLLGSCKTCPSDNVAISALVAEGYHWKFEWVAPSMTDSKFWYFFAVDTSSYTLDLWYLYEWNVQVLTSVTVWVVFLYIVWFLSYSCFSSIYVCGPSSWKHAATMQFQKCMNQEQLYYYCIPFNRQIWFVVCCLVLHKYSLSSILISSSFARIFLLSLSVIIGMSGVLSIMGDGWWSIWRIIPKLLIAQVRYWE